MRFLLLLYAVLVPALVQADDETAFDEALICKYERSTAAAHASVPARPPVTSPRVERARADIASASTEKLKNAFRRHLAEALAELESGWRWQVARRDQTAKALAACVAREREEFDERAETRRVLAQQEADKRAAEDRERKRLDALMSDRPTLHVALSAKLCVDIQERAAVMREIATEKKYARIGGVINLSRLAELQGDLRDFDERMVKWRADLRALKAKELPCAKLKSVAACIQGRADETTCSAESVAGPLEAATHLEMNR